jgi:hypothetical protein
MEPLSPGYAVLRDILRERFGISNDQATGIARWLETEYDLATNAELQCAYFDWLAGDPKLLH